MAKTMLALALAIGVATARADAPKQTEMEPELVTKLLAFFDRLVDVMVAAKADCEKMAKDATSVIETNKAVTEAATKAKKDGKKLPKDAIDHMGETARRAVPAVQACGGDGRLHKAFKLLDGE
jgi:hypothetical protein